MFCREYLVDLNAAQAAIRAGYSEKTARQVGSENLSKPDIQDEITQLMSQRVDRLDLSADHVVRELMSLAFSDVGRIFAEDGTLKPLHEIPVEVRKAIAGIDVFEEFDGRGKDRKLIGHTKKVRLWDKNKAIEMLGKYLRMFPDRHEHTGANGGPIVQESEFKVSPEDETMIKRIAAMREQMQG